MFYFFKEERVFSEFEFRLSVVSEGLENYFSAKSGSSQLDVLRKTGCLLYKTALHLQTRAILM